MSDILQKPERLEGDDLYAWAQMIAEESRIQELKQRMAIAFLQRRSLVPGEYMLTNDGYLIRAEQANPPPPSEGQ